MNRILITKIYESSPMDILHAWSDSKYFKEWWTPPNIKIEFQSYVFKGGGSIKYCLKTPGNNILWERIHFNKVITPKEIEFTKSYADEYWKLFTVPIHSHKGKFILTLSHQLNLVEHNSTTILIFECQLLNNTVLGEKLFISMIENLRMDYRGKLDRLSEFIRDYKKNRIKRLSKKEATEK